MTDRDVLYNRIKEELAKTNGQKARKIAKNISAEKKDVNSILYSYEYGSRFHRDASYIWYLIDEETVEHQKRIMTKSVRAREDGVSCSVSETRESCKKCMLYKSNECFGAKKICEFFKHSPDISSAEMEMWPKEMTGPYGTLHK